MSFSISDLPLEILAEIAASDPLVWRGLLAVRTFAAWSTTTRAKNICEKLFVKRYFKKRGKKTSYFTTVGGKIHSIGKDPAIVLSNNTAQKFYWMKKGNFHRENAPAIISLFCKRKSQAVYYMQDGWLHSFNDLPALNFGPIAAWYSNGLIHREGDRPAIVDQTVAIFVQDGKIVKKEGHFKERHLGIFGTGIISCRTPPKRIIQNNPADWIFDKSNWRFVKQSHGISRYIRTMPTQINFNNEGAEDAQSPTITGKNFKIWVSGGVIHRANGPAVISSSVAIWFFNGFIHRTDGPAIETSKRQEWYQGGVRHRMDAPAVVCANCADGTKDYWRAGSRINGWNRIIDSTDILADHQIENPRGREEVAKAIEYILAKFPEADESKKES